MACRLTEIEGSSRLGCLIQICFFLCFLCRFTYSMKVSDLPSENDTDATPNNESAVDCTPWKAHFFYAPPLHHSTIDKGLGNNASSYQPSFLELTEAVRKYREMSQGIVRQLSLSHEVALRTEQLFLSRYRMDSEPGLLSRQLEKKISKVAELLEKNSFVLEDILKPFPVSLGYSRFTNSGCERPTSIENASATPNQKFDSDLEAFSETASTLLARYIPPYNMASQSKRSNNGFESEDQPYEDASQIIAHMTRDWSISGSSIRELTYGWIMDQLWNYHKQIKGDSCDAHASLLRSTLSPVLVAGAGLGRLAFDIAFAYEEFQTQSHSTDIVAKQLYHPFEVEAVDSSIVMASAAHHVFHGFSLARKRDCENIVTRDWTEIRRRDNITHHQKEICPFTSDPFLNEVDTEKRWEAILFPDTKAQNINLWTNQRSKFKGSVVFTNSPDLSYTIGDFVTTYASKSKHQMYGAIATCYFIDTATNVYEYIMTIKNLLRHRTHDRSNESQEKTSSHDGSGLWINVGPLQWHRNAQLQPSVDELRQMVELFGFTIHHWEVEDRIIGYRHSDDVGSYDSSPFKSDTNSKSRFTRSEGYRPLKFVASLSSKATDADGPNLLPLMEKLRLSTGRESMLRHNLASEIGDTRL
ncbi:hypothetical protein ACHAW6_007034 [Cyclotella cf. meneghiniana]